MARAGELDKRVTLQQGTAVTSKSGASQMTYANVPDAPQMWAKVETVPGGSEVDEAGRLQPKTFWKVTIRRRTGLTPVHRFLYYGRALNIKDIGDHSTRSDLIEIMCTEYPS